MEVSSYASQSIYSNQVSSYDSKSELDSQIIASTVESIEKTNDRVSVGIDDIYKNLSVTAQEIVKKLNELLGEKLPAGIESLRPDEVTPEATADRIVTGATAFFGVFQSQNPELKGDELVDKFMQTIKSGIKSGYDDAVSILGDLGAFEFEGVKSSIEETMNIVERKLKSFEDVLKSRLAEEANQDSVSDQVSDELIRIGGSRVLNS